MHHSYLRNMAQFRVENPEGFEKYFQDRFEKIYGFKQDSLDVKNDSILDSIVGSAKKFSGFFKVGSDSIGFKKLSSGPIGFTRQGYDSQGLVKYG